MFSDLADSIKTLRKRGVRHILLQMLSFTSALASCLMMWDGLCLITNTESPVVVVLSGSMEPAFYRGDLIFLVNPPNTRYQTGDITVYKIPGQDIPIVHRVIETHDMVKAVDGVVESIFNPEDQLLLTKGDNNAVDDVELYRGLSHLERKHIVGKVRGFLPYVGYVTIAMESLQTELRVRTKKLIILQNDFPQLKYAVFGGLGLLALIQRG